LRFFGVLAAADGPSSRFGSALPDAPVPVLGDVGGSPSLAAEGGLDDAGAGEGSDVVRGVCA
jgi:hypothetical protein